MIDIKQIKRAQEEAAWRALGIFTRWLKERPECSYTVKYSRLRPAKSAFELVVTTADTTVRFNGESSQDVCAQAAQAISFDPEFGVSC